MTDAGDGDDAADPAGAAGAVGPAGPAGASGTGRRPQLPDPQQDRHVAFPDLTPPRPVTGPTLPANRPARSTAPTPAPALPPEAWAPAGGSSPTPLSPPVGRPTPGRAAAPSPTPAPKRSAWPWVAAVVGALVVLGNMSDGTNQDGFTETTMAQDAGDNPDGMSAEDATGWIVQISEDALAPPLAPDTPVSPVPDGTEMLRVEVVSLAKDRVSVQLTTDSGLVDESYGALPPVVREFHVGSQSQRLEVRATRYAGGGVPIQCRVYAGKTLVALTTGPVDPSCIVTW